MPDLIAAEPIIRGYKKQHPSSEITVAVEDTDLLRNQPDIKALKLMNNIGSHDDYDIEFHLQAHQGQGGKGRQLMNLYAEQLHITEFDSRGRLYLDSLDYYQLSKFDMGGYEGLKIAICPDAENTVLRWPEQNWRRLCEILRQRLRCRLIGLGSDNTIDTGVDITLAGRCSSRQNAAVLSQCDAAVTVDNEFVDLAAAVSTPSVTLFGPTKAEQRLYQGWGVGIVGEDFSCSGCDGNDFAFMADTCPQNHHGCMTQISVEATANKVIEIIEQLCLDKPKN